MMIPDTFTDAIRKAMRDRVVVSQTLINGFKVFAYPASFGPVVGIGCDTEFAVRIQPDLVLRKRAADLPRYGRWLPTLFNDGSCYVVRRCTSFDLESGNPILTENDLGLALELLS